ncbi:MAG: class I SAM-dependent methyltransferase [Pirellulaceae bacterium]|nr:class I SAM-dependent methyltransferase [Pirellulaceae bacterium]
MTFFEQFDQEWGNRLRHRRDSFRQMFDYLVKKKASRHLIVETGCARTPDNWSGDGQSTFLFDRFAEAYDGEVISVDIDPRACEYARSIVGPRSKVFTEDSVAFLRKLTRELLIAGRTIDLLYLDSFDWSESDSVPSALHHLKELCAISPVLAQGAMIIVDDSFRTLHGIRHGGDGFTVFFDSGIGGKGKFVAEYFKSIGVPLEIDGYQCGWILNDWQ